MKGTWTIRALEAGDIPSILQVARGLDKWITRQGLCQIEADLGSHAGYVAASENRIVGFVLWTAQDKEVAGLSWVGVAEEAQHSGIGTALLARVFADLRRNGYRHLEVSTVADTVDYAPYAETRRFYRSHGFADYRVDKGYYGEGEDRYDRLVLRRHVPMQP